MEGLVARKDKSWGCWNYTMIGQDGEGLSGSPDVSYDTTKLEEMFWSVFNDHQLNIGWNASPARHAAHAASLRVTLMSSGKLSVSDRGCRNSCVCCQEMSPLPRRSCAVTVNSVLPSRSLMTVRRPSVDKKHDYYCILPPEGQCV